MVTRRKRTVEEREREIPLEAKFYLQEGETIRSTAAQFALSKSQVQQDLNNLAEIGRPDLQNLVDGKMIINWQSKGSKGGKARWNKHRKEV